MITALITATAIVSGLFSVFAVIGKKDQEKFPMTPEQEKQFEIERG